MRGVLLYSRYFTMVIPPSNIKIMNFFFSSKRENMEHQLSLLAAGKKVLLFGMKDFQCLRRLSF